MLASSIVFQSLACSCCVILTLVVLAQHVFVTLTLPEFLSLGEESASEAGTYSLGVEPTWIIDPIDGTTNFGAC